jgi:hypothetical protein
MSYLLTPASGLALSVGMCQQTACVHAIAIDYSIS